MFQYTTMIGKVTEVGMHIIQYLSANRANDNGVP